MNENQPEKVVAQFEVGVTDLQRVEGPIIITKGPSIPPEALLALGKQIGKIFVNGQRVITDQ